MGEADGKLKYKPEVAAVAIIEERQRHQELEATGLIVVRWGWADLHEFGAVKQRLETAFRRGARRAPRNVGGASCVHPGAKTRSAHAPGSRCIPNSR